MRLLLIACTLSVLLGCQTTPDTRIVYQEVKVPVPVKAEAPEKLLTPYKPETLPVFLPPDKGVVSLDTEGVNALKTILRTMITRDEAWRAWSTTDAE